MRCHSSQLPARTEEAFTTIPEVLPLFHNTQRQGVLMTPNGSCVSPQTAHSCAAEDFLAIVHRRPQPRWHGQSFGGGGGEWGLQGCFEKMCEIGVWVLRVFAPSGVYCAEGWAPYRHPWSPPLTHKLFFVPCVFFVSLFLATSSCALAFCLSLNSPLET